MSRVLPEDLPGYGLYCNLFPPSFWCRCLEIRLLPNRGNGMIDAKEGGIRFQSLWDT